MADQGCAKALSDASMVSCVVSPTCRWNAFAVMAGGVSLTIADQVKKIKKAKQTAGHVVAFHLDEIKNPTTIRQVACCVAVG